MSIIAISGKMQSGKNTVASIIQYLTNPFDRDMKTEFNFNEDYSAGCGWKQVAFAAKLKQIVSILTEIPIEDLEKQEVKDKELGEEWWKYKVTYRTFDRLSHSPYGEWFTEFYSSKKEAELCTDGNIELDENSKTIELIKLTPRKLLQLLGTDCGRDIIHPNIWCNALMNEYKKPIYQKVKSFKEEPDSSKAYSDTEGNYPNWIITDLRFPNELKAVKDRGGITIRVNRAQLIPRDFEHESETSLDSATFDYVIENDSDLVLLIEKVREILVKEGII